jgi:formate-dependent nitrite reductase cytochrome c552 subunit
MHGHTNRSRKWIGVLALVMALVAFAGCASWFSSDNGGTPIDPKPVITGGVQTSAATGTVGQTATFTVNATDPQGDALTYAWDDGDAANGTFTEKGTSAELTTDDNSVEWMTTEAKTYTISVVVMDEDGNTATASTSFTVNPEGGDNQAPEITALTANPTTVEPDEDSSLTVTATDPDGDALTYTWDDGTGGGTFTGTGASVTYSNSAEGTYTITVEASDGELADSATVNITVEVEVIPNEAPIFVDDSVDPPEPYMLIGDVSAPVATQRIRYSHIKAIDPDGDPITYEWTADGDGEFTDVSVDEETGYIEAYWAADAPGNYVVTVTADDGKGGTSSMIAMTSLSSDAFDVGELPTEFDYIGYEGCNMCHSDLVTPWMETNHANAFENSINPNSHGYRNESCYDCHGVGIHPTGEGGFIDQEVTPQFANIQCESCHGGGNPAGIGSGHKPKPWDPGMGYEKDAEGNYVVVDGVYQYDEAYDGANGYGCGLCHEGSRHGAFEEWAVSPHNFALFEEDGVTPEHKATGTSCVECHNGYYFVDIQIRGNDRPAESLTEETFNADSAMIGCAVCHDPHSNTISEAQLRQDPEEEIIIPFDETNIGAHGNGNICMKCHNGRRTRDNYDGHIASGSGHFGPHGNPQAPVLYGVMGADLGAPADYDTSHAHATLTANGCVDCHMWSRDYISAEEPHIWGHTFLPVVEACAVCHVGETDMEALQADLHSEVAGLLQDFVDEWPEAWKDVTDPDNPVLHNRTDTNDPPEYFGPPTEDPDGNAYRECLWNYNLVVDDLSMGTHNPTFVRDLLNQSIARLVELNEGSISPTP